MGTRSTVAFITRKSKEEKEETTICKIYEQFDGYLDGVGLRLAKFINSGKLVNGFSDSNAKEFNGIGCLAAQYIKEYKTGVGGIYI